MSLNRYAKKADGSQPAIVKELRKYMAVEIIGVPVDLAVSFGQNIWHFVECKPEDWKGYSKKQAKQKAFVEKHGIPIVRTPAEAVEKLVGFKVGRYRT